MKIKFSRINPHRPQFTKHRKNKGQFKRKKKNHFTAASKVIVSSGKTIVIN
tara:strand:- start:757 stop:909 length:153 start_codon:yes stop_codon:yes gene_type:complete